MRENEWEFERAYASFQPKIYRYLTRLIGAREVEDLVQEVFIKVGQASTSFRNESQLSTWIYRIATNMAIDRMKNSSLQRESNKGQGVLSQNTGPLSICDKLPDSCDSK